MRVQGDAGTRGAATGAVPGRYRRILSAFGHILSCESLAMRRIGAIVATMLAAGTGWTAAADGPVPEGSAGGAVPADAGAAGPSASFGWGSFQESYRLRVAMPNGDTGTADDALLPGVAGPEQDSDIRFLADGGYTSGDERFSFTGSFAVWYDADGVPGENAAEFPSIYDVPQPWVDVLSLVGEYRMGDRSGYVRAGRLTTEIGLPASFDGAAVSLAPGRGRTRVLAFGGRSVHFFETDASLFEDWMASIGVMSDLAPALKLQVDYRLTREDVVASDFVSRVPVTNHAYGAAARARRGRWLLTRVYVRGLGAAVSHAGARGRLVSSHQDAGLDVSLDAQVIALDEVNEQLDPYFAVLGESNPNLRWAADAWRYAELFRGVLGVHAGWAGRKLLAGEEGPFNRNMGRLYALVDGSGFFDTGLGAGASLEWHHAGVSDEGTPRRLLTGGGWLSFVRSEWEIRGGTDYQAFKYDYYEDVRELESVRTWYARMGWTPKPWLKLSARYAFERSDRDFHSLTVALTQRF